MRKPRDIDAELKALHDKQRQLRVRRVAQFGELVTATGADALDLETLAGALLEAVERTKADPSAKEVWRRKGDGFFRRERRAKPNGTGDAHPRVAHNGGGGPAPDRRHPPGRRGPARGWRPAAGLKPPAPAPTHEPGCKTAAHVPAASSSSAASCRSPA